MGVAITELLRKNQIKLTDLKGKTIAIDAANHLYQFLTTIRGQDGNLFTDDNGNVTSHLIGLFSRTANSLKEGIKPVYVFDGQLPELKKREIGRRVQAKEEAAKLFSEAEAKHDHEGMKKYAARTSRLTKEMIVEAQKLLEGLGVPYLTSPSEGEAQASYMAKRGDCYAVSSQDADSLLFGTPILIRNLSITGRRKKIGKLGTVIIQPEEIRLKECLHDLGISQEQLICLAMLVGTDYNSGGIKGIGPKKALQLVKKHGHAEAIFESAKWQDAIETPWHEIYDLIKNMKTTDDYKIKFEKLNDAKVRELLINQHNFSEERVEKILMEIGSVMNNQQKGLMDFA